MKQIQEHPILAWEEQDRVTLLVDGHPVPARAGVPVAAALMEAGIVSFRTTEKRGDPRGVFCGIGQCNDCAMIVDGIPNVRTCVTAVRDGMVLETQHGLGDAGGGDD